MSQDTTDETEQSAVDQDYDDALLDARDHLEENQPAVTAPVPGGLAFDLVTRQLLFVREEVAPDLATYYEREEFDLLNYKMHPYLPVEIDDAVFECVYLADVTAEKLGEWDSAKLYDFPAGRLAVVPVMEAWT